MARSDGTENICARTLPGARWNACGGTQAIGWGVPNVGFWWAKFGPNSAISAEFEPTSSKIGAEFHKPAPRSTKSDRVRQELSRSWPRWAEFSQGLAELGQVRTDFDHIW